MKSRILQAKDYRTVDVKPLLPPFVPDEEAVEKGMRRLTNPYVRWEPGAKVSSGDQAVCRLASECPRFQRDKVRFVAGSGMFHRELETLAVGMSVGDTEEVRLSEGRVTLTVLEVTNRIVPDATDEMAAEQGLEGVRTVEGYRAYLYRQQKEEAFQQISYDVQQQLLKQVVDGSEFILYKEDWAAVVERKLERNRILCRQEGLVLEEMTPEQFHGRIPVKSFYELVAMTQSGGWNDMCVYLLGRLYAEADGFQPGEAEYEQFITDYVKTWRTTQERAREANTYENFLFGEYCWHVHQTHVEYIKKQYFGEE